MQKYLPLEGVKRIHGPARCFPTFNCYVSCSGHLVGLFIPLHFFHRNLSFTDLIFGFEDEVDEPLFLTQEDNSCQWLLILALIIIQSILLLIVDFRSRISRDNQLYII